VSHKKIGADSHKKNGADSLSLLYITLSSFNISSSSSSEILTESSFLPSSPRTIGKTLSFSRRKEGRREGWREGEEGKEEGLMMKTNAQWESL